MKSLRLILPTALSVVLYLPCAAQKKAQSPAANLDLRIAAKSFPSQGGFYLDQGKWLAINPEKHKKAQTSVPFSFPSGNYDLTILGVGENDGEASHEVLCNDASFLKYKIPLSKDTFETGPKYHKTVKNLRFDLGDVITVKSQIASADGKEFSRARWAGLVFRPADAATRKAVITMSQAVSFNPSKSPDLQSPRKPDGDGSIVITGNLTQWQPVTLTLDGPFAYELDVKPNPFLDRSLIVTFTHSSGAPEYHVPGYFATDGKAGESSAKRGTKWRAHFSPDKPGEWKYQTNFLAGDKVALLPLNKFPEKPQSTLKAYTKSGKFTVKPTPADAPEFYQDGRLTYVGKHHLQFAGSKRYFLKAGADAPETLLGYFDFDNTEQTKDKVPLKTYAPHIRDWRKGDPSWKGGKGKGLIGALNYLSGKGMNVFSFLPYNAGGDGDNVWPFVSRNQKFHYDCSKLDQWNIVFTHAQARGLFLHFKLQETEMDDDNRGHGKKARKAPVPTALDKGDLGPERKLYCREMVARFGHHLALNWNIGEENTQSTKQQMDMAHYLRAMDPYDHHLVIHTFPDQQDKVYNPLLGEASPFTGASLQNSALKDVHWQIVKWTRKSREAGKKWAVAFDEPGNAQFGMPADPGYPGMPTEGYDGPTVDQTRKYVLWGTLLGGGLGVEYYFGYKLPQNDLVCEDWRSRDLSWNYANIALSFFQNQKIPFWEMSSHDELVGNPKNENTTYCLAKKGLYLLYFPHGKGCDLKPLPGDTPKTIQWFNPRTGVLGEQNNLTGLKITAPDNHDWLAIIKS